MVECHPFGRTEYTQHLLLPRLELRGRAGDQLQAVWLDGQQHVAAIPLHRGAAHKFARQQPIDRAADAALRTAEHLGDALGGQRTVMREAEQNVVFIAQQAGAPLDVREHRGGVEARPQAHAETVEIDAGTVQNGVEDPLGWRREIVRLRFRLWHPRKRGGS